MVGADEDYRGALGASALFWHAQRSGAVTDTLVPWRGNSGLDDVPIGGFYEGSSVQRACAVHAGFMGLGKPHKSHVLAPLAVSLAAERVYLQAACALADSITNIPGQGGLAARTAIITCIR